MTPMNLEGGLVFILCVSLVGLFPAPESGPRFRGPWFEGQAIHLFADSMLTASTLPLVSVASK